MKDSFKEFGTNINDVRLAGPIFTEFIDLQAKPIDRRPIQASPYLQSLRERPAPITTTKRMIDVENGNWMD